VPFVTVSCFLVQAKAIVKTIKSNNDSKRLILLLLPFYAFIFVSKLKKMNAKLLEQTRSEVTMKTKLDFMQHLKKCLKCSQL